MARHHTIPVLLGLLAGCAGSAPSSAILHIECNRHGGKTNQRLQLFESGYTFRTSSSYPTHTRRAGRLEEGEWEQACERFQQVLDATDLQGRDNHGHVSLSVQVFFTDGQFKYVGVPTSLVFGDGRYSFIEHYFDQFRKRAVVTEGGVP